MLKIINSFFYIVFLFYNVCVSAHTSTLMRITNSSNQDIIAQIATREFNSNPNDCCEVCYGTYGDTASSLDGVKSIDHLAKLPRCHSEIFLLLHVVRLIGSLRGCKIVIKNSDFSPCRLKYGHRNSHTGKIECNPGTPCHEYLQNFVRTHSCEILILYPIGKSIQYK